MYKGNGHEGGPPAGFELHLASGSLVSSREQLSPSY